MSGLRLGGLVKNKYLLIGSAVLILLILFILFKPESAPKSTADSQKQPEVSRSLPSKNFVIFINNGQPRDGFETLRVNEGDDVKITVISNQADQLHLHGYGMEIDLEAGVTAELAFKADKTGRFEIELHESGKVIAVLEVQPKL
jgi:heme/copper-type cytochrome/quinol oxidase subunit 2